MDANITITAFLPRQSALREARCRGHSIDAHLAWLVDVYEKFNRNFRPHIPEQRDLFEEFEAEEREAAD